MAQAVWSGTLSFGLVTIPVKLYNATHPREVRFHQFQAGTGKRVRYRRTVAETAAEAEPTSPVREAAVAPFSPGPPPSGPAADAAPREPLDTGTVPGEPAEVAYDDLVKGYEIDRDRYVMVRPEELAALAPEQTRTIEIEDFVDLRDIDPVYFEKSYYLVPQTGIGADKPYWLLLRAMDRAGKVGIARFVLRTKEYLSAIRPMGSALALETLFYADEVREPSELRLPQEVPVSERELDMAERFIAALSTDWDPARYRDLYRERVMELVQSKAGTAVATEPGEPPAEPSRIPDLMEALRASVEAAKKERSVEPPRRRAR